METKLTENIVGEVKRISPDKVTSRSAEIVYSGLCSICLHAQTCFNVKRSKDVILFCEEFDICLDSYFDNSAASPSKNSSPADDCHHNDYTGLCMNCKHRDTCKIPKSAGGIWHCEEYE